MLYNPVKRKMIILNATLNVRVLIDQHRHGSHLSMFLAALSWGALPDLLVHKLSHPRSKQL